MSGLGPAPVVSSFDSSNPLAYLPPPIAHELTIASYVLVSALVIQIWDILNNLNADIKLLRRDPIKLPAVVAWVSRLSTLMYMFYATIYETAPIGNCEKLSKLPPWIFMIALPSTTLLFFLRVSAIYGHNRYVSGFFFALWLAVVGGCIPTTMGVSGAAIGPTRYCISTTLKPSVAAANITPLVVYDSTVFVAISWRLMRLHLPDEITFKDAVKAVVFGKRLSKFSKALLQDGQAYYLSTVGMTLMVLIIFYIDSIPLVYRTLFGLPDITLMNVMACRVYRKTKLGIYRENSTINHIETEPMVFRQSGTAREATTAIHVALGQSDIGNGDGPANAVAENHTETASEKRPIQVSDADISDMA